MIVTPCNWARVTVLEIRRSGKTSLKTVAWQLRHEGEVGVSHAEDSGGEVWEKTGFQAEETACGEDLRRKKA